LLPCLVDTTEYQVLTTVFCLRLRFRAQNRVAQQRIDSKHPLGKLIDVRKRIFSHVRVRLVLHCELFDLLCYSRVLQTWDRKLVTIAQYPKFASLQIAKYWPLGVGLGQSGYGMFLLVLQSRRYEVSSLGT
jgi:hypothetical protein